MKARFLGIVVVALISVSLLGASAPTLDDSLNMRSASNPRISPDGRFVAYELQKTNWEANAFETEIWIAVTATRESYRLTAARRSAANPEWAPDGSRLAFLSENYGKRQIYLIRSQGGEAVRITNVSTGVNAIAWSPDGRQIAFTSQDPESEAMRQRKQKYGDFEVVGDDFSLTRLWTLSVPAEGQERVVEPRLLTAGALSVRDFSWSPDSKSIAFSAGRDSDVASSDTYDIYTLTLDEKKARKLVNTAGPDSHPVWSPDGHEIAYETSNGGQFFYYLNTYIAVVPAGGGTPRLLTEGFDEKPSILRWGRKGIYFAALQRTAAHLFSIDPATRLITRVSAPEDHAFTSFTFTRDFKHVAMLEAGSNSSSEVAVSALDLFEQTRLTRLGEQFSRFQTGTRELVHWKSVDGTLIEGVLIKPAGFDPSKKYPLLVVVHGGPTGVDRPVLAADRYYPVEEFVAKGALVLRPNYRGSAGYGEKFRALNVRNLGIGDSWDVLSGVDYLVAKGWADPDRVGVMGWSQGGYISAFLATSSDRFRAVSVGAGISDWTAYYVSTDIHPFTRQYLKATPWDDPDIYRKTSPISNVNHARTPTLIQHGELDKRVPIANAYELEQALRDRDVPVRMVVYKGFGHSIDKPKQQRAVMQENLDWFNRWLWEEKPALVSGQ